MAGRAFLFLNLAVLAASMELQQVFILSRHNIRAPLAEDLQRTTTLQWPEWNVPATYLTEKGIAVEEKMGEYFSKWLKSEGLFTDGCPNDDEVYIYSNNKQRTIKTANAFSRSAFKNCNVSTHYQNNDHLDLVFAPILKNTTDSFKEDWITHMQAKINNLYYLKDAYAILHRIVDIENSDLCKQKILCDFITKDVVVYTIGEEPNIKGPLAVGNSIVDFFLMSYYDGMPMENVAWGKLTQEEDWEKLLQITRENQNVRFNHSYLSKDISRPMLKFMRDEILKTPASKFTMLVGHDSNLNSVMAALEFDEYSLTGQLEKTPVGGKIVFQKWRDVDSNLYLKIEYVYYSMEQLRHGTKLDSPLSATLQIKNCKVNQDGFCPWSDFVKVLSSLY
ncbi:hypothetical protein ABMA28_011555 [Loxostege sticticalis]|uniref:Glucose-1-phosphatase n=1 Tax=Loxostege sticticalis TaxID=481309 RepID=A0ABD0S7R7_LOXSC